MAPRAPLGRARDARRASSDPARRALLAGLDRESPRHADDQLEAGENHLAILDPALPLGEGECVEQGGAALEADLNLAMVRDFAGLGQPADGLG